MIEVIHATKENLKAGDYVFWEEPFSNNYKDYSSWSPTLFPNPNYPNGYKVIDNTNDGYITVESNKGIERASVMGRSFVKVINKKSLTKLELEIHQLNSFGYRNG